MRIVNAAANMIAMISRIHRMSCFRSVSSSAPSSISESFYPSTSSLSLICQSLLPSFDWIDSSSSSSLSFFFDFEFDFLSFILLFFSSDFFSFVFAVPKFSLSASGLGPLRGETDWLWSISYSFEADWSISLFLFSAGISLASSCEPASLIF